MKNDKKPLGHITNVTVEQLRLYVRNELSSADHDAISLLIASSNFYQQVVEGLRMEEEAISRTSTVKNGREFLHSPSLLAKGKKVLKNCGDSLKSRMSMLELAL